MVSHYGQLLDFCSSFFSHISHGFILVNGMSHGAIWKTLETPMVETPLKFIDGTCLFVVSIYEKSLRSTHQCSFTLVSGQEIGFDHFFFLPSRAMLGQHKIGCDGKAIHVPVVRRFCFQASIFCGMPHCRQK